MRRSHKFLIALLLLAVGFILLYPFALQKMADLLMVQDQLARSDLIIVLGGDTNGERVREGVKLFKQGYAERLLMSGGPVTYKLTNAQVMKQQAVALGVPPAAIVVQDQSKSTREDALFCRPIAIKLSAKNVILVTSPFHTRRASMVFKKVFSPDRIKVRIDGAAESDSNPIYWWKRHEDTADVIWEYCALVMYLFNGYI